jgi:c-di-GMP-binding flagellar brake protein YcgR
VANPKASIDLTQVTQQKIDGLTLSIEVGTRWRVKPVASDKVYECSYVGSVYPAFLLATLPVAAGVREVFPPERAVMVSFLHEDYNICKFETQVKATVTSPFQAVCYAYPEFFFALNLRKHQRAECSLPCSCAFNQQTQRGVLLNVSNGGAKAAFLGEDAYALRDVQEASPVTLAVQLAHGAADLHLPGLVKKVVRDDAGVGLGLMFTDLGQDREQELLRYVETSRYVAKYRFD